MEFLSIEMIERMLSPKDLITFAIVWFFVKEKVASHFKSIENSLVTIGSNIQDLKDSIMELEKTQTKKINELGHRVTKLEEKK
jgi:cation transport regulator ChaC